MLDCVLTLFAVKAQDLSSAMSPTSAGGPSEVVSKHQQGQVCELII